jgi:hypothetical protein
VAEVLTVRAQGVNPAGGPEYRTATRCGRALALDPLASITTSSSIQKASPRPEIFAAGWSRCRKVTMSEAKAFRLSTIEDVIEDAREGRMFILVDDEGRENEGDLVIPAEKTTPEVVNFMAKHGRGLICVSMTRQRVEELGLQPMAQKNQAQHQTAFTVSIEAREGVTTGISAADRAHTIAVAINSNRGSPARDGWRSWHGLDYRF